MNWWKPPISWHCESIYECEVMNGTFFLSLWRWTGTEISGLSPDPACLCHTVHRVGWSHFSVNMAKTASLKWPVPGSGCRAHPSEHADLGSPSQCTETPEWGEPARHRVTAPELLRSETNGKFLMTKYLSNSKAFMETDFHLRSIWLLGCDCNGSPYKTKFCTDVLLANRIPVTAQESRGLYDELVRITSAFKGPGETAEADSITQPCAREEREWLCWCRERVACVLLSEL